MHYVKIGLYFINEIVSVFGSYPHMFHFSVKSLVLKLIF